MQGAHEAMGPSPEERQEAELLRHAAWIRRLALGLVGDAALAEDLVQDTWLAALRRRPSADEPLRPWLGTVLRNAARQAFRGGARRSARQAQARGPTPTAGPEELAERLEAERRLTEELARLDEPFRSTLMLRYYEGLEPSEIARRHGLPAGTVRWRVKRALELLRERLDDRFGERAVWGASVLALARPATGVPWVGPAANALPGALVMHALTKLGIGAAAVVALAVGLRLGGAVPDALWPFAHEEPLALAMRPLAPPPSEPAPSTDEAQEAATSPREPVRSTPTPADDPDPGPAGSAIEARAVDELGAPLAGARLSLVQEEAAPSVRSGRDGTLRLELPSPTVEAGVKLALDAPGFASRGFEAVLRPTQTTYLGTIELAPGGAVSGSVRDANGLPLADVEVTVGGVDVPRPQLESLRLRPAEELVPAAHTSAAGSFLLEGVRTGYVRVWARRAGLMAAYSAPVEVRAGQETYGLELVLEPLAPTHRIAGVVLEPDGAPVAGAKLEYRRSSRSTGTTIAGDQDADAHGRFEFLVPEDTELWITASDPRERFGPSSASAVRTGTGELVLRLAPARHFSVIAQEADGRTVASYGITVLSGDGELRRQSLPREAHEGGAVELRLPAEPFQLRVDAPGFELAEVGPLDPARLSDPLRVTLTPVPGLRGRVWGEDAPAAGVEVSLQARVPPGRELTRNGFRTLFEEPQERVRTDADGRFLLTPRASGAYVVRAERAGLAPAVSELVELGPSLTAPEVELVLTEGGAIEGHVVKLDGTDPAGTILGLSRGDGQDRTLRIGPGGAYRFEHLTPGPWLLVECKEEIRPGTTVTSSSERGSVTDIEWSCRVALGRTTRHDLVLGDPEACVLVGHLRIDGRVPSGWGAVLMKSNVFAGEEAESVALDPGGAFRLGASEPGRYWLVLSGDGAGGHEQFLLDVVHLEIGSSAWELELETGTLEVEGAPAWSGDGVPAYVHLWDGPGEKRGFTVLAGNAEGRATLLVPAGKGRIVRPDSSTLEFDRWPLVKPVEVPRGDTARVRVP